MRDDMYVSEINTCAIKTSHNVIRKDQRKCVIITDMVKIFKLNYIRYANTGVVG